MPPSSNTMQHGALAAVEAVNRRPIYEHAALQLIKIAVCGQLRHWLWWNLQRHQLLQVLQLLQQWLFWQLWRQQRVWVHACLCHMLCTMQECKAWQ